MILESFFFPFSNENPLDWHISLFSHFIFIYISYLFFLSLISQPNPNFAQTLAFTAAPSPAHCCITPSPRWSCRTDLRAQSSCKITEASYEPTNVNHCGTVTIGRCLPLIFLGVHRSSFYHYCSSLSSFMTMAVEISNIW